MVDISRMYRWREQIESVCGTLPNCDRRLLIEGLDRIELAMASFRVDTYKLPSKQILALAKRALKKIEGACADLKKARTYDPDLVGEDVEFQFENAWSEEIEQVLAAQIEKIRAAIAEGGPPKGRPKDAFAYPTILELAELYSRLTKKRPTAGSDQSTEFQRFASASFRAMAGQDIDQQAIARALRRKRR